MKRQSSSAETFGSYIRDLRINNNIGQRELAKKIGVAASYLNDIEKNKRKAPRADLIKKLSFILKADFNLLNDLAANSKKSLAPDIVDFIEKNPKVISLLRAAKNSDLSDEEIISIDPSFISATGLHASLTPSRANGFLNIFHAMQAQAKTHS